MVVNDGDTGEPRCVMAAGALTGTLLVSPRPDGRVVCQNLGNALSDLVVAAAVADAAEAQDAGHLLDTAPA